MITYEKITEDDKVSNIKSVKVRKTSQTEAIEDISLGEIDRTLSAIQSKIDMYTSRRDALDDIRKEVEKEAKKVKLYDAEAAEADLQEAMRRNEEIE